VPNAAPGGPWPLAAPAERTLALVAPLLPAGCQAQPGAARLRLPVQGESPMPSPTLAHALGHTTIDDSGRPPILAEFEVPGVEVGPAEAPALLEALDASPGESSGHWAPGASVRFFAEAARLMRWLLAQQRFVPSVVQEADGSVGGLWQPWFADEATVERVRAVAALMPGSARAAVDAMEHEPGAILEDFVSRTADAFCRRTLTAETMLDTIDGRSPAEDAHVAWLSGLLGERAGLPAAGDQRSELIKRVRFWIGALDTRAADSQWRLLLRLHEPVDLSDLGPLGVPGADLAWSLTFHLQAVEAPDVVIDAADIWLLPTDSANAGGRRVDKPQELLLGELGRAARIYRPLEEALRSAAPSEIRLNTVKAYEFLREHRPVLLEAGFAAAAPAWWDSPQSRLGVRLQIDSGELPSAAPSVGGAAGTRLGLGTLVKYRWQISLGDTVLSLDEFQKLAQSRSPLVLVGGRWVEVRPEDVQAAARFLAENPGGEIEVGRAMRMAYAADLRETGLPVVGFEVTGWLRSVLGGAGADAAMKMPMIEPPAEFVGSLRPYQVRGLSWLAFLDRIGLGACLADDMGLGKTVQFLALLLHERERTAQADGGRPCPTLLVVPMSVVGNWVREAARFAPSLRVLVHHGAERRTGRALFDAAMGSDLVVTTYALAHRDREHLAPVPWARIALDEAQNIKNAGTKQALAIRSLDAPRRVTLTGTPVENRLGELWSILDFLNPGLLGTAHEFRTRFALPIERYRDQPRAKALRSLVQPFVLRRLKTDPGVITDLPEKVETREYCYLTPEQASLYEATVKQMLGQAEHSEGIQRRGLILAGLVRLKQICNHPHLFLKDRDAPIDPDAGGEHDPAIEAGVQPANRSGKCVRLIEMLEEVLAAGGQALVFTQFRSMGAILAPMLRHALDREVLFLHGGTTAKERDAMVQAFQKGDGSRPIFLLSLKAGGVGLNLTGANHVFHFDRWWNPAVESQATDRAYRIGQTRTVQVHKFVVSGTLEERIDQMIEQKTALLEHVIGSGESWLTEMSLAQLRDVLTLRPGSVESEAADISA
ncbi:MAG: DEAD/DEAH box helicase, partial [Phycisphaeraceae bacterium]|nr:DEAD/DEAH box helicase [Phycisphaeraceae bacterium]